jgi:hypothetical protein
MMFTCVRCGKQFVGSTHGNAKNEYCSGNCRKRACEDRHRASCVDCGERLHAGSAWPSDDRLNRRCRECHLEKLYLDHRWRDKLIEEWWNEGLSMPEICDRLGWSVGHFAMEMNRLREAGYNLPYRYRLSDPRHPEQVSA